MAIAADISQGVLAKLAQLDAQHREIGAALADTAIAADHKRATALSIKKAALEPVVAGYRAFRRLETEAGELRNAIESGQDPELATLARAELPALERRARELIERVKQDLVTADDRKVGSVILEVRAGTGGDEAGLWARDLLSAYTRYAGRKGWKVEEMDLDADALGGVRRAIVNFRGEGVWSELAFEAGVHSVKRVPATETQGRIHTSTCTVAVLPEPEEVDVSIDWASDVTEHVTTSQGPGGQNVNKVATAVHLVHNPTGAEVRMQETKSQAQNREKARRLLAARVAQIQRDKAEAQRAAERRGQIGAAARSEKIRVYRYQDNIVADQRLEQKFQKTRIIDDADFAPLFGALIEQETSRRLAEL